MKYLKKASALLSAVLVINLFSVAAIKVKADAQEADIVLKSITVDKKVVYSKQDVNITVEAEAKNGVGLYDEAYALYENNNGETTNTQELTLKNDNGKYTGKLSVDDASSGTWKLDYIIVNDKDGNPTAFYNSKTTGIGQDLSLGDVAVTLDSSAPMFKGAAVDKKAITQGEAVTLSVTAQDDVSGLSSEANAEYIIETPEGEMQKDLTLNLNGNKYEGSIKTDASDPIGTWKLSFISLQDAAGNAVAVYNSNIHGSVGVDLSSADFEVKADTEAPSNVTISVDKASVKTGADVNVTVNATDLSGLASEANVEFVLKANSGDVEKDLTLKLVDGKYQGILHVDSSFPEGVWQPSFIALEDSVGNAAAYYNSKVHSGIGIDLSSGNIIVDNTKPSAPQISVDNTKPTNNGVSVSITGEEGTAIQYKLSNDKDWKAYSGSFQVTSNDTVTAQAIDAAGNISEASTLNITNIDKTLPVITFQGVEDGKVYTNLFINAKYLVDEPISSSLVKIDGNTVSVNAGDSITISAAGKHQLYVKVTDLAGNVSEKTINFEIVYATVSDRNSETDFIKSIISNPNNQQLVLDASSAPIVYKEVFDALKGVDKVVSLKVLTNGMNLVWTFNGKDIQNASADVSLELNAKAANQDIIEKIDKNALILSFKYSGILPAPMTITVPIDPNKLSVDKDLYLYYYNPSTKKPEVVGNPLKAYEKDGAYYVDIVITHCSDYFISNQNTTQVGDTVKKLVQTGSVIDATVLEVFGISVMFIGAFMVLIPRKRKKNS